MKLLIAALIPCYLMLSSALASNIVEPATITPTEVDNNTLPCQPDSELSVLLVQMLMALHPYLLINQQQGHQPYQQERIWQSSSNELYTPTPEPIATTVVTSSVVSTLTQTFAKVISIWYRNERIPTTLYSQTTSLQTDYITVTSILPSTVEPTEWVRGRRELKDDATLLDSSLFEYDGSELRTQPLTTETESFRLSNQLPAILNQPRVLQAWSNFLEVFQEASNNLTSH